MACPPIVGGSGNRFTPYTSLGGSDVLLPAALAGPVVRGKKLNCAGLLQNDVLAEVNCGSELKHPVLVASVAIVVQLY